MDTGCGYWKVDIEEGILDTGYWILNTADTGYWVRSTGWCGTE